MHFIHLFLFLRSVATNNFTKQMSPHLTSALTETAELGEAGVTLKAKGLIKQMTAAKRLCPVTLHFQGCADSSALPSVSRALRTSQLLL